MFGCLALVIVDLQMRRKFDARSQKGVSIDYYENSKAYQTFLIQIQKRSNSTRIFIFFLKHKGWDWLNPSASAVKDFMPIANLEENSDSEQMSNS